MYYSPRARDYTELTQKQLTSAVWNRAGSGYAQVVLPAFAPLHREITRIASELLRDVDRPAVLDVGASAGEPALSIARRVPFVHVVSTDIAADCVYLSKARAAQAGADNMKHQVADAEELQFDNDAFDLVTFSLVLSAVDHRAALPESYRVLKPGGCLIIVEYAGEGRCAALRPVFAALDACVPNRATLDPAFGALPARFPDTAVLLSVLEECGFADCSVQESPLTLDPFIRPPPPPVPAQPGEPPTPRPILPPGGEGGALGAWEAYKPFLSPIIGTLHEQGHSVNDNWEQEARVAFEREVARGAGGESVVNIYVARKPEPRSSLWPF